MTSLHQLLEKDFGDRHGQIVNLLYIFFTTGFRLAFTPGSAANKDEEGLRDFFTTLMKEDLEDDDSVPEPN